MPPPGLEATPCCENFFFKNYFATFFMIIYYFFYHYFPYVIENNIRSGRDSCAGIITQPTLPSTASTAMSFSRSPFFSLHFSSTRYLTLSRFWVAAFFFPFADVIMYIKIFSD
jgi:hypothetical protein